MAGKCGKHQSHQQFFVPWQPCTATQAPKQKAQDQQNTADLAALHAHAQIFVMRGTGADQFSDIAARVDDHVAGAEAPAKPGGLLGRAFEQRPQDFAAAEVGGFGCQHVEQPNLRQGRRGQGQQRQQRQQAEHQSHAQPDRKRRGTRSQQHRQTYRRRKHHRRAGTGRQQDYEIYPDQPQVKTASVAQHFEESGIDRRQTKAAKKSRMAERRQPPAARLHEQRPQSGNGQ